MIVSLGLLLLVMLMLQDGSRKAEYTYGGWAYVQKERSPHLLWLGLHVVYCRPLLLLPPVEAVKRRMVRQWQGRGCHRCDWTVLAESRGGSHLHSGVEVELPAVVDGEWISSGG